MKKLLLSAVLLTCLSLAVSAQTTDEAFLMNNLKEARLMAVDYKNMKEISAIFEIYKTKNEQYFTNSGRDWRTMYSAYVKQMKARKASK